MPAIPFDQNAFRAAYPAFAQTDANTLQIYWNNATIYISDFACNWNVPTQTQYLNLMTAHLAAISCIIASGQTPGMVVGATIDKISVTLNPPPEKTQWQWWLNLTPYGQQLLALMQVKTATGFYVGGSPARVAIRGAGGFPGIFWGNGGCW